MFAVCIISYWMHFSGLQQSTRIQQERMQVCMQKFPRWNRLRFNERSILGSIFLFVQLHRRLCLQHWHVIQPANMQLQIRKNWRNSCDSWDEILCRSAVSFQRFLYRFPPWECCFWMILFFQRRLWFFDRLMKLCYFKFS